MPELAEVEFYRKRWQLAGAGAPVIDVRLHGKNRLFRGIEAADLRRTLSGAMMASSEARAKQMTFRFRRPHSPEADVWLGIHLGMTGELRVEAADYVPGKHDHLVLLMANAGRAVPPEPGQTSGRKRTGRIPAPHPPIAHALVFSDPRMFGRIRFHLGSRAPAWWTSIAPAILSSGFTVASVANFLQRRRGAPIKAVLLMQDQFPGVGNWMADEILWRAAIHPRRLAGSLSVGEVRTLWRECRHVCRLALTAIAGRGRTPPPDLNVHIPDTWLFHHRWQRGGRDPLTGTPLAHATIGGRTTCWSPARQKPVRQNPRQD